MTTSPHARLIGTELLEGESLEWELSLGEALGHAHTKRYMCEKLGELASKLMRTQNARRVQVL